MMMHRADAVGWKDTNSFLIINSGSGRVINQLSPVFYVGTDIFQSIET